MLVSYVGDGCRAHGLSCRGSTTVHVVALTCSIFESCENLARFSVIRVPAPLPAVLVNRPRRFSDCPPLGDERVLQLCDGRVPHFGEREDPA